MEIEQVAARRFACLRKPFGSPLNGILSSGFLCPLSSIGLTYGHPNIDPRWAWEPYTPDAKNPGPCRRSATSTAGPRSGRTGTNCKPASNSAPTNSSTSSSRAATAWPPSRRKRSAGAKRSQGQQPLQASAWWLVPDALHAAPAAREADAVLAQPLRHQQRQGAERRLHARPVRPDAPARPGQLPPTCCRRCRKDPAMLVWLDTSQSKKGKPNENYARELMELFSPRHRQLHREGHPRGRPRLHRLGDQGRQGVFNAEPARRRREDRPRPDRASGKGDDIVRICLEQQACPHFIVGKLYRFLVSETMPPTPELLEPLAEQFRKSDYDFGKLVETMLRSNLFFSPTGLPRRGSSRRSISSLGIVRGLEGRIGTTRAGARRWRRWARTCSTRRRSRAGTAARPGSTARRCCRKNLALALSDRDGGQRRRSRCDPAFAGQARQEEGRCGAGRFLPATVPARRRARRVPREAARLRATSAQTERTGVLDDQTQGGAPRDRACATWC